MSYNFNEEIPIYLQITEHIKMQIISNKYLPNQKLPSVRDLSFEYEVNPNTVLRALTELEIIGLIYTERTNGKFVTGNKKLIDEIKKETTQKMVEDFYESMEKIGITKEQVLQILTDQRSKK